MGSNPTLSATPRMLRRWGRVVFCLIILAVFPGGPNRAAPAWSQPLRLGIGEPMEERILGRMAEELLERAGIEVQVQAGLAPEALRDRALKGELDLFWDYTGRALIVYHKNPDRALLRDPVECLQAVGEKDLEEGLVWGVAAPGNNSYGLIVTQALAQQLGLETVSDLALKAKEIYRASKKKTVLGLEGGFKNRPDGFGALMAIYSFEYNSILAAVTPEAQLLDSLRTKQAQAVVGPTVDGRIKRFELQVLVEDKPFFPSYNPAPVWRREAREAHPRAAEIMDRMAARLDIQALNELRFPVEVHAYDPAEAVREWLAAHPF